MTGKGPLIAFTTVHVRRRIPQKDVKHLPDIMRQVAAINNYARVAGRTVDSWIAVQTTYRPAKFYRDPSFLHAVEQSVAAGGELIVGDAMGLMAKLSVNELLPAWNELRRSHPNLISALHLKKIGSSQFNTVAIKDLHLRKALTKRTPKPAARATVERQKSVRASESGGRSTKAKSNVAARLIAPVLSEIIKDSPGISLAGIAKELNDRGVPAPRGGIWHASSVRNVLNRCRGLRLLQLKT